MPITFIFEYDFYIYFLIYKQKATFKAYTLFNVWTEWGTALAPSIVVPSMYFAR